MIRAVTVITKHVTFKKRTRVHENCVKQSTDTFKYVYMCGIKAYKI
mgnify:FL=1